MAHPATHTLSSLGQPTQAPAEPLAWSFTRRQTAERCARQYYWQYIGTRGGAYAPAGSLKRRAWSLKQSTSLPLLVGTVVHNAARQVVEAVRDSRPVPEAERLYEAARLPLVHAFITSTRQLDRFWAMPAVYPAFREVIARGELRESELAAARGRLETCLLHLTSAAVLEDLRRCEPGEFVLSGAVVESFLVTPEPEAVLAEGDGGEDITVMVALDLAYRHVDTDSADGLVGSPTWTVADWKTGQTADDDVMLQLGAYALYLRSRGMALVEGAYLGRLVNLATGGDWLGRIAEPELGWVLDTIDADVRRMQALHARPMPSADDPPAQEAFPYAAKPNRSCPSCAFLTLCTQELGRRPWMRPALGEGDGQLVRSALPGVDTDATPSATPAPLVVPDMTEGAP